MSSNSHVKSLLEETLSKILSDKYDANITLRFGKPKEEDNIKECEEAKG